MSKEHAYAYEAGYRDGSIHYELEHCPACKNVADLQEALDENAKLRELALALADCRNTTCDDCVRWDYPEGGGCSLDVVMRELGVEE